MVFTSHHINMVVMCKPRWKIVLFIFIYLLLLTKGNAKSRLSFQNGFSSLSFGVILDVEENSLQEKISSTRR